MNSQLPNCCWIVFVFFVVCLFVCLFFFFSVLFPVSYGAVDVNGGVLNSVAVVAVVVVLLWWW